MTAPARRPHLDTGTTFHTDAYAEAQAKPIPAATHPGYKLPKSASPAYLSLTGAARYASVSPWRIVRWWKAGHVRLVETGAGIRVCWADLDRMLNRKEDEA